MARNRRAYKYSSTSPESPAPPVWRDLSETKRGKIKKDTENQIDEFMKRVGYANPAERTDENGGRWFSYGSAKGRAGIVESDSDGEMFLRVESLVMELPAEDSALLPLMRELLEANLTIAGPTRIAISGESVFVCATVPLVELVPGDVPAHIHSVMVIAEKFVGPTDMINADELLNLSAEETKPEGASQEQPPPEKTAES